MYLVLFVCFIVEIVSTHQKVFKKHTHIPNFLHTSNRGIIKTPTHTLSPKNDKYGKNRQNNLRHTYTHNTFYTHIFTSNNSSNNAPTWRDYLSWLPEKDTHTPTTPISEYELEKLPTHTLKWGNITVPYKQPYKNGPIYINQTTADYLEGLWDPNELKAAKQNAHEWDLHTELTEDSWVPMPGLKEGVDYFKPIKVETDVDGYDRIETFYDPERNYTWSYKSYNPHKVGNQTSTPHEPWTLSNTNDQRYYLHNVSIPRKELDVDIFRKPTLEDSLIEGMSAQPPGEKQSDYILENPYGVGAEFQKFWPTVEIRENIANNPPMRYTQLGQSDIKISEIGLGTMTFGNPTSLEDCYDLLDYSVDEFNINFFDTAEIYPLPTHKTTLGMAEEILGNWLKKRGKLFRPKIVISTKIAGPSQSLGWIRPTHTHTHLSKEQIIMAVEGSLKRLHTDYIDLVQFHWPERYTPSQSSGEFSDVLYNNEIIDEDVTPMEEQLEAIHTLIKQGKIRHWGLSNETPYGVMKFWQLSKEMGLPPPASLQLNYNLLCRNDVEKGFVELLRPQNTGIGLIAYGPLAGGVLTGKYLEHLDYPTTGRMLKFPSYMKRYRGSLAARAIREYYDMSIKHSMKNLAVTSLRWVYTRPFVCATLIGATNLYQLRENCWCVNEAIAMSDNLEREINTVHWKWRDPIRIIQ